MALGGLAAFAISRSVPRPKLAGTRPPLGARDISLLMYLEPRVPAATTRSSGPNGPKWRHAAHTRFGFDDRPSDAGRAL